MDLEENATIRWNSLPHFQLPEQPPSRFIDRLIRLKTTYWNRAYAIVLLALIGLTISTTQTVIYDQFIGFLALQHKIEDFHYEWLSYGMNGYYIGLIPGGVLATVYPAHNILGIFIILSSVGHLINVTCISYINAYTYCFLQFFIGMTTAAVDVSISRIWTYWVPLNKQTIRHVPIVFFMMINGDGYFLGAIDKLHDTHSSYLLTLSIGVIGLAWYVLWLYVINGNYSFRSLSRDFILFGGSDNSRYSAGFSLTRSVVSDIPWKSICTSKPVFAIALLQVCNSQLVGVDEFYSNEVFEWSPKQYTIILSSFFVVLVLVELFPEIIAFISTTNVRKFWSCSYFGSVAIYSFLEAFLGNTVRSNETCQYIFKVAQYLFYFGFYVNILDIAPKYASLLDCILMSIHYVSKYLWDNVVILSSGTLNDAETDVLKAVVCLSAAVVYAKFASAEVQPWAVDEPVEETESHRNIVENDN